MSKPNQRRVRMQQFQHQIAEQVLPENNLIPVDLDDDTTVYLKIPVVLPEGDDFLEELQAAKTEEQVALVVLAGYDGATAQEQWDTWRAAGYSGTDLMKVFATERAAAEDRLKAFRYKG